MVDGSPEDSLLVRHIRSALTTHNTEQTDHPNGEWKVNDTRSGSEEKQTMALTVILGTWFSARQHVRLLELVLPVQVKVQSRRAMHSPTTDFRHYSRMERCSSCGRGHKWCETILRGQGALCWIRHWGRGKHAQVSRFLSLSSLYVAIIKLVCFWLHVSICIGFSCEMEGLSEWLRK